MTQPTLPLAWQFDTGSGVILCHHQVQTGALVASRFITAPKADVPMLTTPMIPAQIPCMVVGTAWQTAVWRLLTTIPRGQTLSYTELAARLGRPRAVRAAASACGANPLVFLIPCHRVICKNGALGGYSGLGGITTKARLLSQEQQESPADLNFSLRFI
jgi:AraC family transcriptional regulator of adaptative response/methylated-DNA-[protein]-cysteine methyltransferase